MNVNPVVVGNTAYFVRSFLKNKNKQFSFFGPYVCIGGLVYRQCTAPALSPNRCFPRNISDQTAIGVNICCIKIYNLSTFIYSIQDQSIAFIGRSGSGKTANFRHVLSYLSHTAGSANGVLSPDRYLHKITIYNISIFSVLTL